MSAAAERRPVYLRSYLAPLGAHARARRRHRHLRQPPGRGVGRDDRRRDRAARRARRSTRRRSTRLARQIAALSHQGISREHPLLSATLPDGARVQVVAPPATRGPLALAIRKHVSPDLTLDDYVAAGAFAETQARRCRRATRRSTRSWRACSTPATSPACSPRRCSARKNILVSGGTSTGKTTFLNALLREIPADERLILIEDTPELQMRPRQCGRPARGARRAGRGAGRRRRPARGVAAHAARPHHPGRAARARRPTPSCARSIPAIRAR